MTENSAIKKIIFLVSILIIFTNCSDQLIVNNDLTDLNLFGRVKSVKNSYRVNENVENDSTMIYITKDYIFNLHGKKIEETEYREGEYYSKKSLKLNDSLNLVEVSKFNVNNELYQKSTYTYLYDSKGLMIGREEYGINEALVARWSYKYNSNSTISTLYEFDSKGNPIGGFLKTTYNNKDLKVERTKYYDANKIASRTLFKYDNKGNITEISEYKANGNLKYRSTRIYNEKDQEIESNTNYDPDDNFGFKNKINYDRFGNQTEYISFDLNGRIESKSHTIYIEFDKYNNWIKAETSEFNKPELTLIRKIEYYN